MQRVIIGFIAALLLMPALALGATEGVVQAAPPVQMDAVRAPESAYLPDESDIGPTRISRRETAWAEDDEYGQTQTHKWDISTRPELTPGEVRRLRRLMERASAGEIELTGGEDVIGATRKVSLGVYPLDPAEFGGERVFVILPGFCMTDEQLIALIDAYDRLGLPLDPEGFSAINCMRGGGRQISRHLAMEEGTRDGVITRLIQRGMVSEQDAGELPRIELDPQSHLLAELGNGEKFTTFTMLPYRSLTDAELITRALTYGERDLSGEFDLAAMEKLAYERLTRELHLPLSLKLRRIYSDRKQTGDPARYMTLIFDYTDAEGMACDALVRIDQETLEPTVASIMRGEKTEWVELKRSNADLPPKALSTGERKK